MEVLALLAEGCHEEPGSKAGYQPFYGAKSHPEHPGEAWIAQQGASGFLCL